MENKYKYISFDVFDTLLFRSVKSPEQIFDHVERRYNQIPGRRIQNFRKKRIRAEHLARRYSRREDVTLEEIYKKLNVCLAEKEVLKEMEIRAEEEACHPNKPVVEMLRRCVQAGVGVIIISDMYLDAAVIRKLLSDSGIGGYERLYVSSDIGLTKRTGHLFDHVLKELDIRPEELLHIGDNRECDYQNPRKRGIRAYLLDGIGGRVEYKLGYKLTGPFLYHYCTWLHEQDRTHGFDKIVFTAREGWLPYMVYRRMFPEEQDKAVYLRINKNTLRLPMLWIDAGMGNFKATIPERDSYTAGQILEFLFIDADNGEARKLLKARGYTSGTVIARKEMKEGGDFYLFYQDCIQLQRQEARRQYQYIRSYLQQNCIRGKIALVNNSIHASAQGFLNRLAVHGGLDTEFVGIHFVISKKGRKKIGGNCLVWFDCRCSQFRKRIFYRNAVLFEHLLFEKEGTALQYIAEGGRGGRGLQSYALRMWTSSPMMRRRTGS